MFIMRTSKNILLVWLRQIIYPAGKIVTKSIEYWL